MKVVYWLLGLVVGIPTLFFVTMYGASELGGEVVTLDRTEANGDVGQVRVWIVDADGMSWIEHGEAEAAWITRLSDAPDIVLTRDGRTNTYTGTPDRGAHDQYHRLRREKYGVADQIIAVLLGKTEDCDGLPVRLQIVE